MCGIVGVISNEKLKSNWTKRKAIFRDLLIVDTVRGWDSTGIFGVPHDEKKDICIYKKAVMAPDIVEMEGFKKHLNNIDWYTFFVGHNRAATKGKVNNVNAHPFHHGDIVGVHNGTLRGSRGLDSFSNFDVDSEALIYNLANNTKGEGYVDVIENIHGAFALVWFDTRDDSLHIIRNSERTLFFSKLKGEETIVFASEKPMIDFAVHRNEKEVEDYQAFEVGVEYIFPTKDPMAFIKKERNLYKESPPQNYSNNPYGNNYKFPPQKQPKQQGELHKLNKTRDKKVKDKLTSLGYDMNEEVKFYPVGFKYYCEHKEYQSLGVLEGIIDSKDFPTCVIHNLRGEDYEEKFKAEDNAHLFGKVKGVGRWLNEDVLLIDLDSLKKEDEENVIDLPFEVEETDKEKKYIGPNGRRLSEKEWDTLTKDGCCSCTGNIYDHLDHKIAWSDNNEPICQDCIEMFELNGIVFN